MRWGELAQELETEVSQIGSFRDPTAHVEPDDAIVDYLRTLIERAESEEVDEEI